MILPGLFLLQYLRFPHSAPLKSLQRDLKQLTHLKFDVCVFSGLDILIRHLPNRLFLDVIFPFQSERPRLTCGASRLKKLIMKCRRLFSWSEVESFFSLFPSFECLIFESDGERDLLDGRRWQGFIERHLTHLKRIKSLEWQ